MRFRFELLIAVPCLIIIATGCNSLHPQATVDVSIRNDSTNYLDWVSVVWGSGEIRAGILPPGAGAKHYDAGLPKLVKTNIATLEFVDDNDRKLHALPMDRTALEKRKAYVIPIDVSALRQLSVGGHYHVTFVITSFTEAKLVIDPVK